MTGFDDNEILIRREKDEFLGQVLGDRYELLSVLGQGGMGIVYYAKQLDTERYVAVKTLHATKALDAEVIKRFQSEAQTVSRVRHPHTVAVYDFGVSQTGQPYIVMELLEGISLRKLLATKGPLSSSRVNYIFQQVCQAVDFAHTNNVIHKDLKPENIMLSSGLIQDWVYVLDFGIASLLIDNKKNNLLELPLGSPPYMSPEQCSKQNSIDHRSDIYSLGICVFEALCGKFPYQARTAFEIISCHIHAKPLNLKDIDITCSTYESLSRVINKALEKEPKNRFQSVAEFANNLEDAINKDAKRSLALKNRIVLERPRTAEFVEIKEEALNQASAEEQQNKPNYSRYQYNILEQLKFFLQTMSVLLRGDKANKALHQVSTYLINFCPHCNAKAEPNLLFCLLCGRSLVAKDNFSKLRVTKGEFFLPKVQEVGQNQISISIDHDQHLRLAMQNSGGNIWHRNIRLIWLTLLLILVFLIYLLRL